MRVVVDRDRYALCLTVRFSKTLKYQQKVHEVWITGDRSPTALLDPVRLWQGYVAAVPAEPSDPAFCFHAEDGSLQPLDFTLLAAGIKSLIAAIGLDPSDYSSHSQRRGGATYAFQSGVAATLIKIAGDWSSDAFEVYLTLGAAEKLRCTHAMLTMLYRHFQGA